MASNKKAYLTVQEALDRLPGGVAAVILYPNGDVELMLPKHRDEEVIEDGSPTMRASLAGVFLTSEAFEEMRAKALERMKEMN